MSFAGGETYVWFSSKRLCHFRQRLHDRLKDAMCLLAWTKEWLAQRGSSGVAINQNGNRRWKRTWPDMAVFQFFSRPDYFAFRLWNFLEIILDSVLLIFDEM